MKKTFFLRSLCATVAGVLFTAVAALAQGPGSGGPTPNGPIQTPIDGGAALLLAAGGAYGLKRLQAYRAAKKQS